MEFHILQRNIQGLQGNCIAIRSEQDPAKQYGKILDLEKTMSSLLAEVQKMKKLHPHQKFRNERLQYLHKCMLRYENITGGNMIDMKQALYRRYGISSRENLTDEQLEAEIAFFLNI